MAIFITRAFGLALYSPWCEICANLERLSQLIVYVHHNLKLVRSVPQAPAGSTRQKETRALLEGAG